MKQHRRKRLRHSVKSEEFRASQVAVGTLLLVSLIYAATIIG